MKELIERLQSVGKDYDFHENALIYEAADALKQLQEEITALRASILNEAAELCEKSDRYRGDYFAAKIRGLINKDNK